MTDEDSTPLTPLCELARLHACDKGGQHQFAGDICHNYTPAYHKLLGHRREEVQNVLEIGVNHGASLRMWADYFPNAKILGLDNDYGCLFTEGRITCRAADQGVPQSLRAAVDPFAQFDLIVDDGSHEPAHQIFTFHALKRHLRFSGIYVIEDIKAWKTIPMIAATLDVPIEVIKCPRALGRREFTEALIVVRTQRHG